MQREIFNLIDKELSNFDCTYRYENGGRHARVVIKHEAGEFFIPYSLNPTDRGLKNFRADVRRALRRRGVPELRGFEKLIKAPQIQEEKSVTLNNGQDKDEVVEEGAGRVLTRMSNNEVIQATMLFMQHSMYTSGVPGSFVYSEGWSDEVIAKKISETTGRDVRKDHIVRLRQASFATTPKEEKRKISGNPDKQPLEALVQNLIQRVTALEDAITKPRT